MSRKGRDLRETTTNFRGTSMQSTRWEDWKRWQVQGCDRLPATYVAEAEHLPESWETFFRHNPSAVLLESGLAGRYTYLCDRPACVVVGQADGAEILDRDGTTAIDRVAGAPLAVIERLLQQATCPVLPGWPEMTGGFIGLFGYDLVRTWERLPTTAKRDLRLPLYALIQPAELFIFDALTRKLGVICWVGARGAVHELESLFEQTQARAQAAYRRWRAADSGSVSVAITAPAGIGIEPPSAYSFSPDQFHHAVRRAQNYIAAGDTYQVNLSLRTSKPTAVAPETIYDALRRVNPSPYMGLFKLPDFALVCGSPELLVRLANGVISSRPIAGTRPRGTVGQQDSHFSAELLASEKERAEHLMLVDLIRNDIGRVAEYGSVEVREFMVLERYSHVMHIVSQVEGRLASGASWRDVFQSMFPGGTITGCPKIRTMEIIEELEPVGRAFYTGALGWINHGGEMELNIVIRSMLVQDGAAHVQAGAGIVADSQPERELDEALRKAQALWVALEQATNSPRR